MSDKINFEITLEISFSEMYCIAKIQLWLYTNDLFIIYWIIKIKMFILR